MTAIRMKQTHYNHDGKEYYIQGVTEELEGQLDTMNNDITELKGLKIELSAEGSPTSEITMKFNGVKFL